MQSALRARRSCLGAPGKSGNLDIELGWCSGRCRRLCWLTSFVPVVEASRQNAYTTDETDKTRRLKEQEGNDQESVEDRAQIPAGDAAGACTLRQQREGLERGGDGEHKGRAKDRAPDAGRPADEHSGNELNREHQIPL